jgi:D-beta-D-heptose 7-phosphate kinase/D-beta-D-heptose 1-phosphate adenosyltransferase
MKLNMPRFNQARILVVGDVMLDRYWHGGTSRVSPEAPVPVVKVEQSEDRPGGAGNVALNVAALGAAASLVGITGADEAAESLQASLSAAGVACDFSHNLDQPTIIKLRVISRHQQLLRMDFEEVFGSECSAAIQAKAEGHITDHGAVVLSDYAKGVLTNPQPIIAAANAAGIPVLVDPKGSEFERYRNATLLTPNLQEFEAVVGACDSEQELVDKGQELMAELNLKALLVTRGEHGMTLLRPNKKEFHFPARAREVFDVTGAGDTVISVVATALAAGEEMPQAVALANLAASIVVGKLGTAGISAPELRRAVQIDQGSERGIVSKDQLIMALADARAHGEKVVMTNGCFDIIHAGHVSYLEQARVLGDRLIVAINSDDSVRRLKGTGRPINPEDRRMAVLAGLESVDWVLSFEDDTPENLLRDLKPDLLVKGGDYDHNSVVGWEIVEAYGGKVKVLSFVDNVSTTAIVEQIKSDGC